MNKIMVWKDALIERITRRVLNKQTGTIYTDDLLSITELNINNQYFGGNVQCLQDLVHYKNLRILKIEGNPFYDYKIDWTPLVTLNELEELRIYEFRNIDLSFLSLPSTLKCLWIHGTKLLDITAIANLTNLEELVLEVSNECNLTPLISLFSLKDISIVATDYSEEEKPLLPFDLDLISSFDKLDVLYLADVELTNIKPFSTKLTELIIETDKLNLSDLIGLGNIETLELRANVENANLSTINELCKTDIDNIKIFYPREYRNYY